MSTFLRLVIWLLGAALVPMGLARFRSWPEGESAGDSDRSSG